MDSCEQILYLRNLISIAQCDGTWDPQENAYVEATRSAISATKTQFKNAMKDIELHEINLIAINRLSDRIRNLEDMVSVAFADGRILNEEKRILVKAAKAVGISQDLVNIIVSEVKKRLENKSNQCPGCQIEVPADTKFCPTCGVSIDGTPTTSQKAIDFTIPNSGIMLTFAKSTAAGFEDAVRLAKKTDNYQEVFKGPKEWFGCAFPISESAAALTIAQNLKGMRNRKVFIDGQERDWSEVFGFVWCPKERGKSFDPTKFCFGLDDDQFNIWGCKLLDMEWNSFSEWLTFGRFSSNDVFEFDLERIEHELEQKLTKVWFCPHLRQDFIRAVLKRMSEKVKVGYGTAWDYREAHDPDPRAVKLNVIRDYDGEMEKETIMALGVEPCNSKLAVSIINEAAKECGMATVSRL